MISVSYFTEQAENAYKKAMEAYSAGEYADAAKDLKDGAYYFRKAAEYDKPMAEKLLARAEKLEELAVIVTEKNARQARKVRADGKKQNPAVGTEEASMQTVGNVNEFFTFIPADSISVSFEDVVGLEDAKQAVTEYVINPIRYPAEYNYRFLGNKGILLEGPPGTGKSMFAKAVAKEINQPFALINMAQLVNCYVGETGKNIDKVFAYLRAYTQENGCGATIFFDEFDEIAKRRGGEDKAAEAAVPALLRNLDGFLSDNRFLIIANTNCKARLDGAILDRFRQQINIPLPNTNGRYLLFLNKTTDMEQIYREQIDWKQAATLSEGLSGRAITFLCDDLKYYIAGVKAGIHQPTDLNEKLAEMIRGKRGER